MRTDRPMQHCLQNDTVDVWLPVTQANDWGVQDRTITINQQAG
jgi:hypothetical protein